MLYKCFYIKLNESNVSLIVEKIMNFVENRIDLKTEKEMKVEFEPEMIFKELIEKFYKGSFYIKLEDNHIEIFMETGLSKIPFPMKFRILALFPSGIVFEPEDYMEIDKELDY